ncbi:MAG: hypothetical protein IPJ71_04510 [Bdellovibrionales bacterium]|nr:hypothetical protein [Bdellovibrionales bacterium]
MNTVREEKGIGLPLVDTQRLAVILDLRLRCLKLFFRNDRWPGGIDHLVAFGFLEFQLVFVFVFLLNLFFSDVGEIR